MPRIESFLTRCRKPAGSRVRADFAIAGTGFSETRPVAARLLNQDEFDGRNSE
jgi:hypothetical protein